MSAEGSSDPLRGRPAGVAPTITGAGAASSGQVVLWQEVPAAHDYPAAASYLSLIAGPKRVRTVVKDLQRAPIAHFKAKDILRASRLPLLPRDNPHVATDLAAVAAGHPLSPCLLVRGNLVAGRATQIADGYHRVCASYHIDENTDIPVKIATL